MRNKGWLTGINLGMAAIFCLLSIACAPAKDDQSTLPSPEKINKTENQEPPFFANGVGRAPIRLQIVVGQDGQKDLYGVYRSALINQPNNEIYICTLSEGQVPVAVAIGESIRARGATLILGEALTAVLTSETGSYFVTESAPVNVDLARMADEQKAYLVADATVTSWPVEGGARSCRLNFNTARRQPHRTNGPQVSGGQSTRTTVQPTVKIY